MVFLVQITDVSFVRGMFGSLSGVGQTNGAWFSLLGPQGF